MSQAFEKFGNYILLEKLQTGGMAEIYLARRPGASGVSRFVAIKRVLPSLSEQPEIIEMFKTEAKIAVQLNHANIVTIHEFGIEKLQFFLAMDYVEGRNLRQILNKMKKSGVNFSIEQVLYIIKEVAGGLDHAHRCIDTNTGKPLNIIHRDVSPQNVMVSFEGEVKVVDFGIAKAETAIETTRAGTLKGKFGYMSPEQAEGSASTDLRTDIFALGIVLWEMLANDRLFVSNNEVNTLRKVRDCQIPSLRKINPNIPPELERIVSKALAKDRNLRYQTAAAFHRELSRFLNRQFPDFSPHDFSVFIKTLFAAEILESRKKMVEYSKVNGAPSDSAPPSVTAPPPRLTGMEQTEPSAEFNTFTESTDPEFGDQPKKPSPAAAAAAPVRQAPPTVKAQPAKPRTSSPQNPNGTPMLNANTVSTGALSMDRTQYRDGTSYGGTSYGTGYGTRSRSSSGFGSGKFLPAVVAILAIALAGAYLYPNEAKILVAKFWESAGRPAKNPEVQKFEQASKAEVDLVVMSTPSGAEILIDNQPQPDTTPATLRIEKGRDIRLSIRMPGHLPVEQILRMDQPRSSNVVLQAERLAKINVNVVGAGKIFVNGKLAADGSPLRGYVVRADQDVVVRAEDPVTRAVDQTTIRMPHNGERTVTLYPKSKPSTH